MKINRKTHPNTFQNDSEENFEVGISTENQYRIKKPSVIGTALSWIFAVLCLLCRFAYSGHFVPVVLFTLAGLAALPIKPIRNLWERVLSGRTAHIRTAVLVVVFLFAVSVTPSAEEMDASVSPPPETADRATVLSAASAEIPSAESSAPITTPDPIPEATEAPTPEPTPEATPEPTEEPTPEPTVAPTPEPQPVRGLAPETIVYVSSRSNTIHSVSDCSGMKNYREMTIYDADQRGYKYCSNCW